jgi:hypothetical protein
MKTWRDTLRSWDGPPNYNAFWGLVPVVIVIVWALDALGFLH